MMPGTTERAAEKQAAEKNEGLIDRYLNDKLSAGERDAFEIMMLEDEQLYARVELLDAFKRSLVAERAALRVKRELLALPFRAWLQQPLSLAASVLVVGLGLQVGYDTLVARDAASGSGAIGSLLLVEATRGAAAIALSGEVPYLFQIDAGPNAANTEVSVSLRAADGAELLHVDDLRVDQAGWARVVFAEPLSGAYTLELTPAGAASASRRYEISVSD